MHPPFQLGMPHILVQIPHCLLIQIQSLQIPVHFILSLVLSKISQLDQATQSVLPLQIDWYGPSRPSTSYMVSTQSNLMTSTSSNSLSGVQRFFQEFRLPDYTLDSFSGRLLDVVSSTTFSSGDVQVELHHAITRLMAFCVCIL